MPDRGESYALPLEMLLTVLQGSQAQTYQVHATVPATLLSAFARRGETFEAVVHIVQGKIRSCQILNQRREIQLEGPVALERLQADEQLVWVVQAVQEYPSQEATPTLVTEQAAAAFGPRPTHLPWEGHALPLRRGELSSGTIGLLERRQRQVLLLIDGKRKVNDLCTLLRFSPQQLSIELNELEAQGLITITRP